MATSSCRLRLVSAWRSVQLLYWGPDPIALPLPRVRYVGPVSCCSLYTRVGIEWTQWVSVRGGRRGQGQLVGHRTPWKMRRVPSIEMSRGNITRGVDK